MVFHTFHCYRVSTVMIILIYYQDGGEQFSFVDSDGQEPRMM